MWKTKNVSHISTPPATTTDTDQKTRYTNTSLGTKNRSGQSFRSRDPARSGNGSGKGHRVPQKRPSCAFHCGLLERCTLNSTPCSESKRRYNDITIFPTARWGFHGQSGNHSGIEVTRWERAPVLVCGGHRVTGVPTAIVNNQRGARFTADHLELWQSVGRAALS